MIQIKNPSSLCALGFLALALSACGGSNACTQDSYDQLLASKQKIANEANQLNNAYGAINSSSSTSQSQAACQSINSIQKEVQDLIDKVNGTDCSSVNASGWSELKDEVSQATAAMPTVNQVIQTCQAQHWL